MAKESVKKKYTSSITGTFKFNDGAIEVCENLYDINEFLKDYDGKQIVLTVNYTEEIDGK